MSHSLKTMVSRKMVQDGFDMVSRRIFNLVSTRFRDFFLWYGFEIVFFDVNVRLFFFTRFWDAFLTWFRDRFLSQTSYINRLRYSNTFLNQTLLPNITWWWTEEPHQTSFSDKISSVPLSGFPPKFYCVGISSGLTVVLLCLL